MLQSPPITPTEAGLLALREVVDSGLLRCGVPAHLGGSTQGLDALAHGAAELARQHPAAARLLWAQRLAIEALLQSPNVALREHWLADFLSGERAATVSPSFDALRARDTGRGWLLQGELILTPNLQWAGFSVVAPVRFDDARPQWVMLRNEEDGLGPVPDTGVGTPAASLTATLKLELVYFREDEWLCGPDLPERVAPVAAALTACWPHATDWNRTDPRPLTTTTPRIP
ncbi:acyl-CoA dehydrogenase family protein [Hydrogenophaga sp. 2FB]|uniref:acyl-CoA dehydrogenase family protein n=1 Tax=Hydrogenophaga sp. 2FB TaxID=2502187 RepID=UPI0010F43508|nr:acyl-CoA dehydrogenase family protein [Hydrogenophaga sp. 2FB]